MTDPSGLTPIAGNPAAQTGGKGQVVQIVSLPDGLQNNARAIRLQGEVIQQNDNGSVRVRTPQGDIDINVRGRQPQQGQQIEIDVPPGSPPKQATIRPAPAQPPQPQQPAPQPPPATSTPLPPQPPVTRPTTPTPATGGTAQPLPPSSDTTKPATPQPVQDVFQPTQTKPAAPAVPLPPLAPGTIVKLVPQTPTQAQAGQTLPQKNDIPVADRMTQAVGTKAQIVATKSEGNLITTLLNAVKSALPQNVMMQPLQSKPFSQTQDGTPLFQTLKPVPSATFAPVVLNAKVTAITLPSGQSLTLPATTAATTAPAPVISTPQIQANIHIPSITITVTEITPQQQPVIPLVMNEKGAVQNFILQSPPASVPIGTQVTLQPQTPQTVTPQTVTNNATQPLMPQPQGMLVLPPSAAQLPPAWRTLLPMMQPASVWPVMDELFQTFYQATPQAAQILGRAMPSPGNPANFGAAVLLFAAALKSGDLQSWLGDKKLEMVQKLGKESLLSRLSGESSSLPASNDASATDWKSFPVPMLWQNEISKVMFHVRKEPSENEQQEGEAATRFVMDLSLTRMGDVQIDGMVRGKQLDLIVRTQLPISYSMQDAMRVAYAKALDGTDIYGDIGFQAGRDRWETVLKSDTIGQSV